MGASVTRKRPRAGNPEPSSEEVAGPIVALIDYWFLPPLPA
jgi:hypothetical protein